jgi:hypothetical protein
MRNERSTYEVRLLLDAGEHRRGVDDVAWSRIVDSSRNRRRETCVPEIACVNGVLLISVGLRSRSE